MTGLVKSASDEVFYRGAPITGPAPERGVIFQNYSLLPWMTVYQNVALSVNQVYPGWPKGKRGAHIRKFIDVSSRTQLLQHLSSASFGPERLQKASSTHHVAYVFQFVQNQNLPEAERHDNYARLLSQPHPYALHTHDKAPLARKLLTRKTDLPHPRNRLVEPDVTTTLAEKATPVVDLPYAGSAVPMA